MYEEDIRGLNALYYAVNWQKNIDSINYDDEPSALIALLSYNPDLYIKNKSGKTILEIGFSYGELETQFILRDYIQRRSNIN